MSKQPLLTLDDLSPQETKFSLSDFPNKQFTFKRFTMNDRIFVNKRWPGEQIQKIFNEMLVADITELAWHLLKEKEEFSNNITTFMEHVVTTADIYQLIKGVLGTIGLSEPLIDKLAEEVNPKTKPLPTKKAKLIGRRS